MNTVQAIHLYFSENPPTGFHPESFVIYSQELILGYYHVALRSHPGVAPKTFKVPSATVQSIIEGSTGRAS